MKFITPKIPRWYWLGMLAFGGVLMSTAFATTVVPPAFDQLVHEADYVVRGTVKSVNSQFESADSKKIITLVEIEVSEVVAGVPPQKVVLRLLGGKVGDNELVVEGAPRFSVGEDDIIFVKGNGKAISPVYALRHGRYRVMHDAAKGDYVARDNDVPLRDTAEVAQPMTAGPVATLQKAAPVVSPPALTPQQFIQRIKQSAGSNYTRPVYAK